MQEVIAVSTSKSQEMIDITAHVSSIVKKSKVREGMCNVYAMHATAAIVVNENADSNICLDTIDAMNFLRQNSNKEDIVLSYYPNGHFISSMAERKNFIDNRFTFKFKEFIDTK